MLSFVDFKNSTAVQKRGTSLREEFLGMDSPPFTADFKPVLSRSCGIRGEILFLHEFSLNPPGESVDHWLITVHWPGDLTFSLLWVSRLASSVVCPCGLKYYSIISLGKGCSTPMSGTLLLNIVQILGEIPSGFWLWGAEQPWPPQCWLSDGRGGGTWSLGSWSLPLHSVRQPCREGRTEGRL